MNTRTLKLAVIAAVTLTGGYFVFSAINRIRTAGRTLADLPAAMGAEVSGAGQAVAAVIQGTVDDVKSSLGIPTNPEYVAPEYVRELKFSQWPVSAKNAINMLNKTRGIKRTWVYEGDFTGWHVYSNGVIVSPDGFYLRDLIAQGEVKDSGFNGEAAVNVIPDSFSGLTFDQTKYQWQIAQEQ